MASEPQRTTPPRNTASARWQAPVDTPADLPTTGNVDGDIREVLDDGDGLAAIYQWGGASWVKISDPSVVSGAVLDGDFVSEGLMRRGAVSGSYSVVTDASANWNSAYSDTNAATNTAVNNAIVKRDGSGGFAAGGITATSLDAVSAPLTIGGSGATSVTIGKTGLITTVNNGLSVDSSINAEQDALRLKNTDTTSNPDGSVSVQMFLADEAGNEKVAGKVIAAKEQTWDSTTVSTIDSKLQFYTINNNAISESMSLSSVGDLTVTGDVKISGNNITDAGGNAIIGSNGGGGIDLSTAAKTTTINGPLVMSQGKVEAFSTVGVSGATLDTSNTWINADCGTGGSAGDVAIGLPRASVVGAGFLLYIHDFNHNVTGVGIGFSVTITAEVNDRAASGGTGIGGVDAREIVVAGGYLQIISNGATGWGIVDSELS